MISIAVASECPTLVNVIEYVSTVPGNTPVVGLTFFVIVISGAFTSAVATLVIVKLFHRMLAVLVINV